MTRVQAGMKILRGFVLLVCGSYLLLLLPGFLIDSFVDPNTSFIELIKTVFELGLWLAVPVLLLTLLLRAWRLSLAAMLGVIAFGVVYMPYLIARSPDVLPEAPQLTIMTFNLKGTSDDVAEIVRGAGADIVALQELSQAAADALRALEDIYPHQALHPQADSNAGQGVLSRYPFEEDTYWEYANVPHTLGHQRVAIAFNDTQIVLYNTHPWPPLAWETGYNDESHRVVVQDIAARVFAEDGPLILAGDFNMTDNFEEYERLASYLTDSYRAAGDGVGYTFPNYRFRPLVAILRLDYIWHSPHFASIAAEVWPEHGQSDHSPVVARLALLS